jgi:phosphoribosylaminoimidazole carboxylase PurE protein
VKTGKVAIIMGSASDARIMKDAAKTLRQFKVPFEMKIVSAHRTPQFMQTFALEAKKRNVKVIIAGAGGAAHLPGMVASLTTLPVIGVPVALKKLQGLDSLLSIAQMPSGVPVASVAIDNATNAALLAVRILAVQDLSLERALSKHQKTMRVKVRKSEASLKKFLR